jgi:chitodextrinase
LIGPRNSFFGISIFSLILTGCPDAELVSRGLSGSDVGRSDTRRLPDSRQLSDLTTPDDVSLDSAISDQGLPDGDSGVSDIVVPSDTGHGGDLHLEGSAPFARTADRIDLRTGDEVTFDGSESYDPDGTIVAYRWDFGDTGTGTGAVATHVYTAAGSYAAALVVEDNDGRTDSVDIQVRVRDTDNLTPVALILAPDPPILVNDVVQFDGSGSTDDGTIVSYGWEFSRDGVVGVISDSGAVSTQSFTSGGNYTARLLVEDDEGAVAVDVVTFSVWGAPIARITGVPEAEETDVSIDMSGATSSDADGEIVSFDWDFDDGNTEIGRASCRERV